VHIRWIEPSEYEEAAQVILHTFHDFVAASIEPQGVKVFEAYAAADAGHY
jgi:hypothetical protein